jgi:hypothetical protein
MATLCEDHCNPRQQQPMNCSKGKRTAQVATLLLLAACSRGRDQVERFRGAEQSVNVFRFRDRIASPYDYRPAAATFTMNQTVTLGRHVNCVYAAMLAPFDIYWDGEFIGRNNHRLDNFFVIPAPHATSGPHELEIRVTARPEKSASWFHGVVIGDYQEMIRSRIVGQVIPLSGFAVFVVIGIYYVTLSFAMRRRGAALTFAMLCFAAALLAVAETWRWTVGYAYEVQATRLAIINVLTFCVSLLLPAFFVLELELKRPRLWLAAILATLVGVELMPASPDPLCIALFSTGMLLSAIALITAVPHRKRRTIPGAVALSILVVALISGGFGFSDNTFFIAFCLAIACLLISMALDLKRERRERESLEVELLQKMIEPHFVMNTLTAVMEWLEHDPATGVKFLEAFADELRIFSEVSRDATIPIGEEIALCRSHLEVMGCRKGKRFQLRADAIDPESVIPPAVLHTLVENALTHNRYRADDVEFVLTEERVKGARRYVFDAPLDEPIANGATDGTGLRYVKARLEESYPGKWTLTAGQSGAHWRTTIEVPA